MRMLKGLVRSVSSTMKVELENGLNVEVEAKEGFYPYDLVEVAFDFCRREVVSVEHVTKFRLAHEETSQLETPEDGEVCECHASEGVDYPTRMWEVDAYTPDDDLEGSGDLAPDGAELEDLGIEGSRLEVSRDLAPDGADSRLEEFELIEILEQE